MPLYWNLKKKFELLISLPQEELKENEVRPIKLLSLQSIRVGWQDSRL